jgi:phosphoenolpyruvate carboxykinase (GTP)
MLELKKGVDILADLGGVKSVGQARSLFEKKMDKDNLAKIGTIKNEEVLIRIANAIGMCDPDSVYINGDSEQERTYVREMALKNGEEEKIGYEDHTVHFDLPEDQGRLVSQTFYIVNEGEETSVLAKKQLRAEAHQYLKENMVGIMKGKTMIVGFYNRGPIGAKAAIPGLMITSSFYVIHSGNVLYPNSFKSFDAEVERAGVFFTNVHSEGTNRSEDIPKARIFMDRSWQTCFSCYCTYAGNTLLLKKGNHRFAVDLCTYYREEDQLSEHMFITGMTGPGGRRTFFAGAAPSGCGKTTTAMVGTDFIGDDLAQIWIEKDGTMRAVNPEIGIFGIVEDVNDDGDPYLMKVLRNRGKSYEVIWSNILVDDKGVPHWVGDGDPDSEHQKGRNYVGEWKPGTEYNGEKIPMSNPNARCTLHSYDIENYNQELANDPAGVPISVITYSGRDADTMPPIWVAKNPDHGVVIGASIVSAATATEVGATGVRRQPWANEPFIPGPLADYMVAQFKFFNSSKLTKKPLISGINYFLTWGNRGEPEKGKKLLGEKRDVKVWLSWLERRAHGEVKAFETPIGFLPLYDDLKKLFKDLIDKEYPRDLYDRQFSLYIDNLINRLNVQKEAYKKEKNVPERLFQVYDEQLAGLEEMKAKYGPIVKPELLEKNAK